MQMHRWDDDMEALASVIVRYAENRIANPQPLDGPRRGAELSARAGRTITPEGLGGFEAFRTWTEVLAPATVSTDHPMNLAFVPASPTKASVLFELVVGASSIIGAGWLDGGGAIWAENQALRWVADLAGLPEGAGGVFVSGGSAGNLSGLAAARHTALERRGGDRPARWTIACSDGVHSSVVAAARVMDVDVVTVPHDERGRLTGPLLRERLSQVEADGLFAVSATAGTTNAGVVDDLAGIAEVCRELGLWMHVDGAYGGAALCAPSVRHLFEGVELADSFIVDPHKWLFAPYDCCALLYREPALAARAFTQEAAYLEDVWDWERDEWSPSHFAYHLSRRVRGVPFWFSLATHGTDAYRDSVEAALALTRDVAEEIRRRPGLELVLEPELSVILFRRHGWEASDYRAFCDDLLARQIAFVQPTSWEGEKVMRFCFVNPRTRQDDVVAILDRMV
jgi:glutamate/tyrosine decarboxylase-like PLP-dependent enzyme